MACYREICLLAVLIVATAQATKESVGVPLPYANNAGLEVNNGEADQDGVASSYSQSYAPEQYQSGYESYIVPAMAGAYGISHIKPGLLESFKPHMHHLLAYMPKIGVALVAVLGLLLVGTLLTTCVCAYTSVCHLSFLGHRLTGESMRGFVTQDRVSEIAAFLQSSISKYQDLVGKTKRAAIATNEVKK